jgi:hypothetical protein
VTTSRTLGWGPTDLDGITVLQRNGLFDAGTPVQSDVDRRFTKLVGFWAPRRWRTTETMDVDGMVAEIEHIVGTRGLVAYDGQVITSLRRLGPWEACFEAVSIDTPLDNSLHVRASSAATAGSHAEAGVLRPQDRRRNNG